MKLEDVKTVNHEEEMLKLKELLESIEQGRLDCKLGYSIEKLDLYLEEVIKEA